MQNQVCLVRVWGRRKSWTVLAWVIEVTSKLTPSHNLYSSTHCFIPAQKPEVSGGSAVKRKVDGGEKTGIQYQATNHNI